MMEEKKPHSLQISYVPKKNSYPHEGAFVLLAFDSEGGYVPHHEPSDASFLAYVTEVRLGHTNECDVELCSTGTLENKITLNADELTVCDVELSWYEKSINTNQIDGLNGWLKTNDTYHGLYVSFEVNKRFTVAFFELIGVDIPNSFFKSLESKLEDNKEQTPTPNNGEGTQADERVATLLSEIRKNHLSMIREHEIDDETVLLNAELIMKDAHPFLFKYSPNRILVDVEFILDTKGATLTQKPFAREFLISLAYLGFQITILTAPQNLEYLEWADIPYHATTTTVNKVDYDFVLVKDLANSFCGFVMYFNRLFAGTISLLDFPELVYESEGFDDIRDAMNMLYGTSLRYGLKMHNVLANHYNPQ